MVRNWITIGVICLMMTISLQAQDDPFASAMRHLATSPLKQMIAQASKPSPIIIKPSSDEGYAALEANMFARMNWGEEEIAWFRATYGTDENPSIFGSQQDYIHAVAEGYAALDEQVTLNH